MNNPSADWTPATVQQAVPQTETQIDLGDLFALMWRRKFTIAAFAIVSTLLSIVYVQQATPLYLAQATLILEAEEQNITGLEGLVGGTSNDDAEMNSQIEIIRSRKILGAMVDQLGLASDEEFVSELRDPSWLRSQVDGLRGVVVGMVSGIKNLISSGDAETTDANETKQRSGKDSAIDSLVRKLDISVIPNTHVFSIKLETTSPEKSSLIVNTLSETFVTDKVQAGIESTSGAADWLGEKVADLGVKLADAEAAAADYRSNTDRNVTTLDVASSNLNLKNARGRLISFETNLEAATGSRIPRTDRDRSRYAVLKEDIVQLEAIVRKQTEDLLKLNQLDRAAEAAATIYAHFVGRLNEIEVQKGLQESDIRVLSRAIPRYQPTKPRKLLTVAFAGLLGLLAGAAYVILRRVIDRSFKDPKELQRRFGISVIGTIPRAPVKSRRALLKYAKKRPASALMEAIRDMRTSLNLTGSELTAVQSDGDDEETRAGKVLVMTSSVPGEGKTTSSILLAVNSAALNKKVLLVECDLRRSTFRSYFNHVSDRGLVDLIDRTKGWEKAVWHESDANIDVVYGGRKAVDESSKFVQGAKRAVSSIVQGFLSLFAAEKLKKGDGRRNAADVFASQNFRTLVDEMRQHYDLIILDSPPVLPVPDARLIAKVSDAIVYVVHSGSTPESVVADGLRLFDTIGVEIDGLALTQMKAGDGYGYSYYGSYANQGGDY